MIFLLDTEGHGNCFPLDNLRYPAAPQKLLTSFSSGGKVGCPIFLLDTEGHGDRFSLVYLRYLAAPQKLLTGFSSGGKVGCPIFLLDTEGHGVRASRAVRLCRAAGSGNRLPLVYLRYLAAPPKLLTGLSSGGKVGMRFSFLTQKGMAIASHWSISDILQLLKSC